MEDSKEGAPPQEAALAGNGGGEKEKAASNERRRSTQTVVIIEKDGQRDEVSKIPTEKLGRMKSLLVGSRARPKKD